MQQNEVGEVQGAAAAAAAVVVVIDRQNTRSINGFFSRTAWVSRHHRGETNLDFDEARDDGMAAASAGPYTNHLHLAADR